MPIAKALQTEIKRCLNLGLNTAYTLQSHQDLSEAIKLNLVARDYQDARKKIRMVYSIEAQNDNHVDLLINRGHVKIFCLWQYLEAEKIQPLIKQAKLL